MKLQEIIKEKNNLLNEGALTDFLTKIFGKLFKRTVGATAETLLQKVVNEVVQGGTKKITMNVIRKNSSFQEAFKITLAEASRVKYGGKTFDELVKFDKNAATKLANDVQTALEKELMERSALSKNIIDKDVKTAASTVTNTQKGVNVGKATSEDLKMATKELVANTKLQTRYAEFQKAIQGMDKLTINKINTLLKKETKVIVDTGETIAGGVKGNTTIFTGGKFLQISKEQLKKFPGKVKRVIIDNPVKSILIGAGLTAAAAYFFFGGDDSDGVIVTDQDGNEVKDFGTGWAVCIQELIKSGTGKIETSGEIVYVNVVTDEYPKGLHFFSSGKVMDIATNKTGTWKCKSGQPVISESKKLSMLSILKEQSTEIDATTMGKYVDSAVWELDGYVDTENLENVKNILTKLKGKTFQGKDAITEFLSLYSEDEGGDSFVSDVNSVGVKTLGTQAILHKREILSLAQGGGGTTTDTKKGLGNVEITWDGDGKIDDGKKDDGKKDNRKQSSYHDCTKKPLPHEKFCRSGQVKQVQICLGLPEKYQTGNFGPITIAAIEKLNIDLSNGLTQGVIDSVCKDKDVKLTSNITTKDIKPGYTPKGIDFKSGKIDKSKFDYVNNTSTGTDGSSSSVDNQSTQETPEELYNRLKNEGLLEGDEGVTYYPDGSKIGPSRRIKYLGSSLSSEQLNGLDNVLSGLGYTRIKQKPKNKGLKYVWQINK